MKSTPVVPESWNWFKTSLVISIKNEENKTNVEKLVFELSMLKSKTFIYEQMTVGSKENLGCFVNKEIFSA